ncbi:MAG: hypothetical protein ABIX01_10425 [Chitinophagaceae bacterium]
MIDTNIEDKVKLLHKKAAQLLQNKAKDDEIITALIKEGINHDYATLILDNVKDDVHDKKEFRKHWVSGSFITIAGLLVNYLSYEISEKYGAGSFLLLWGIVLFGILIIVRGFIIFRK